MTKQLQSASRGKICEILALDIRSFFDQLGHLQLKKAWKYLLDCSELPADHYAVYKPSSTARRSPWRPCAICSPARFAAIPAGANICSTKEFRQRVAPRLCPLPELEARLTGRAQPVAAGIPSALPSAACWPILHAGNR